MNCQHPNIKFTMEKENSGRLPFLDISIQRKKDGTLGHDVYRKPTHTDLYLNAESHHHPSQKNSVLCTLIHRAKSIADEENFPKEIRRLKKTFAQNGYSKQQINVALKRTLRPKISTPREDADPVAKAVLPYVSTVSGKISRILRRFNIATIHRPAIKLRQLLVHPKDPVGLKTPGIYSVPCECGKIYIGETGRTIETRMKEHLRHYRLGQLEKSAVAEHSILENHCIHWEEAGLLCRSHGYWDRIYKEAMQIKINRHNFNRDNGFRLSKCWDVLLRGKGGPGGILQNGRQRRIGANEELARRIR
jgi:hypothetical protein